MILYSIRSETKPVNQQPRDCPKVYTGSNERKLLPRMSDTNTTKLQTCRLIVIQYTGSEYCSHVCVDVAYFQNVYSPEVKVLRNIYFGTGAL